MYRANHARGKRAVHNDIGIMLMNMNIIKLAIEARRNLGFQNNSISKKRNETIKN